MGMENWIERKNMGFIVPKEKMTNEQIEFISALKR